ncbi:hypothetical protein [Streptomyces uncialis]|uniref:Chitin-binding type-3 domain-containing protein n=1 Tax=Streptomyces uncialis TaxID=1048205 RepID=A0A1Q4VAE0_9ACTN|nr:hypothetical protein [Streptomyces uncialis]MCX4658590.1 hypothetical protein [Streptomyces uncialis]OKH94815.1 hypothetical protein AB852_11595 [Streptomyces uncialis]WTE14520.1 hypothetical protein OG924_32420 [Streptomyces uncialis]
MSVRKVFASVAIVAAVAGAGLMTASTAQAAPQTAAAQSAVGPTSWVPRGDYASRGECNIAGDWFVRWGGASHYTCSLNAATQRYDLAIWRP